MGLRLIAERVADGDRQGHRGLGAQRNGQAVAGDVARQPSQLVLELRYCRPDMDQLFCNPHPAVKRQNAMPARGDPGRVEEWFAD